MLPIVRQVQFFIKRRLSGRLLANSLSLLGIDATIIPDSSVCAVMNRVSKVILSADYVLPNGEFIGVTGSRLILACARIEKKSVLVLAGLHKISPIYPSKECSFEHTNPTGSGKIQNPVHDFCDEETVTFITNHGIWNKKDIHRLINDSFSRLDQYLD